MLLLDDDVVVETEGILRAVNFADFCRIPTIVGGHMFNLFERSVLHAYGESVNKWKFLWGPAGITTNGTTLASQNLRTTPWMHRRWDVDFNGWWMCLIPTTCHPRNRPVPARLHQVGRRGIRHPRKAARVPDRVPAGHSRLAHALDGEGRHHRLAGLLPRA